MSEFALAAPAAAGPCAVGRDGCAACTDAMYGGAGAMCVAFGVGGAVACDAKRQLAMQCDTANGWQLAAGDCMRCLDGAGQFFDKTKGTCVSCRTNCAVCTAAGVCTACRPGFALKGRECIKCTTPGCAACSHNKPAECTACAAGYALSVGACQRCTAPGCSTCPASTLDECSACLPGYTYNKADKACDGCASPENCARFADGCTCQACEPGHRLSGNRCALCDVPNCCAFSDACTCSACQPGFQLDRASNTCLACQVQGCAAYSSGRKCKAAMPGFQVVPSTRDTKCKSGFQLTRPDACQPFCERVAECTQTRGLFDPTGADRCACSAWSPGFSPNPAGSACDACPATASCTAYDADCKCAACAAGTLLYGTQWLECGNSTTWNDPNCRFSSGCSCSLCKPGYYSSDGCRACSNPNCKTLAVKQSLGDTTLECDCLACNLPYVLTTDAPAPFRAKSRCQRPPLANCQAYDGNCQCISCNGYVLQQGKCRTACNITSCASCTSTKCNACADGYQLETQATYNSTDGSGVAKEVWVQKCTKCPRIANCASYSADCSCKACAFDALKYFSLINGQCSVRAAQHFAVISSMHHPLVG
ncbi:hypothetical protein ABPG75_004478 [Micractinium tetrahymenae]